MTFAAITQFLEKIKPLANLTEQEIKLLAELSNVAGQPIFADQDHISECVYDQITRMQAFSETYGLAQEAAEVFASELGKGAQFATELSQRIEVMRLTLITSAPPEDLANTRKAILTQFRNNVL